MSIRTYCDGCNAEINPSPTPAYLVRISHVYTVSRDGSTNLLHVEPPVWPPAGIFHPRCVPGQEKTKPYAGENDG